MVIRLAERNDFSNKLNEHENIDLFIEMIKNRTAAEKAVGNFVAGRIDPGVYAALMSKANTLPVEERMRLFSYMSCAATGEIFELLVQKSLSCIRDMVIDGTVQDDFYNIHPAVKKEEVDIQLPLRVNWCGTWTDTPPYCLEQGGAVVNSSVVINGALPVRVVLKKLTEKKIILECFDSGCRSEQLSHDKLSDLSDPLDPFLLLKSALAACGLIPISGIKHKPDIFEILHCGLSLSAGVVGIPKGSGLGTSSILLAASIMAVFEFIGKTIDKTELYRRVLLAEQLMGTGGGWQDQAGGLTGGIKFVSSEPGYRQNVRCEILKVPQKFLNELSSRFCLVYSGQRRMGRTILRQIMEGYIQSDPVFLDVLNEINSLAYNMKKTIESGDMEGFIENLNKQTGLTNLLNADYTDARIDEIFDSCADMTAAKMICGAGGGGFIQIFLKTGYSKHDLSTRLTSTFPDREIDVWACSFI